MTITEPRPELEPVDLRERAVRRLKKKRDFQAHLLVYLLVNTCLVVTWAMTDSGDFFWPIFVIAFWGIGVVMNAWETFRGDGFSEDKIRREMSRLGS